MNIVARIKRLTMSATTAVASLALLGMTLLIMVEIVMRWLFNASTQISTDFVAYGLGIVFYFGASKSFDEGGFVRMDVLFEAYSGRFKKAVVLVFDLVIIVYNTIIWRYFLNLIIFTIKHDSKAMNIFGTRLIYPRGLLFIGITLFGVYLFCRFIEDAAAPVEPLSIRARRKQEALELEELLAREERERVPARAAAGGEEGQ